MIVNKYNNGGGGSGSGSTDLSGYWNSAETQVHIDSAVTPVSEHLFDVEQVTASALTELHDGLLEVSARTVDMSGYYTSAQTNAAISAATSGKADAATNPVIIDARAFPKWNAQGIITGITGGTVETVNFSINGRDYPRFKESGDDDFPPIYAPTTSGNPGEILVSVGSGAPVWSAVTGGGGDMSGYWNSAETKSYVDSAATNLQNQIDTMDDVVAAALVDLNDRVYEISGSTPDLSNYWTSARTQDAISAATQDMVTSTDVRHIVKLAQAAYDELVQYDEVDPYTFYIIVNSN